MKSRGETLPQAVSADLADLCRWVGWSLELRKGKETKVPCNPHTGRNASSTDPATWGTFREAADAAERHGWHGVGVVLGDGLCGIDLDGVRDPATGELTAEARRIVDRVGSYTEISPSGTGLHILYRGTWPDGGNRRALADRGHLEGYGHERYFTFTGEALEGAPASIEERTAAVAELHAEYFGTPETEAPAPRPAAPVDLADSELLRKMFASTSGDALRRLWNGDTSDYPSDSEADLAALSALAFWTRGDRERMDRLYRQSGLCRLKWTDRNDYRKSTLDRALNRRDFYDPAHGRTENAPTDDGDTGKETQAETLLRYCDDLVTEYVRERYGELFVWARYADHHEMHPVSSGEFRLRLLLTRFVDEHGKPPGHEALRGAIDTAKARCLCATPRPLHNRVAWHNGGVVVDLTNARYEAAFIEPGAWRIGPQAPIFRRYAHQQAHSTPQSGGDPRGVLRFVNVPAADECLFLAWLAAAFVPDIPHPVLIPYGEQGTGKTSAARIVRRIVDPVGPLTEAGTPSVLSQPGNLKDIQQQLDHNYLAPYDNLSTLPTWLSDALCRAVTGEGASARVLYTDDDDFIRGYRRVVMLTGIGNPATRGDLLDRSILLELGPPARVLPERALWAEAEAAMPSIVGGLFDALADALARLPHVSREGLPRMADFAVWGQALAPALGFSAERFMADYAKAIDTKWTDAAEGNLLAKRILELLRIAPAADRAREGSTVTHGREGDVLVWQGTPTDLYHAVTHTGERPRDREADGLPANARQTSEALTRVAPALRRVGVRVETGRARLDGTHVQRYVRFELSAEGEASDGP